MIQTRESNSTQSVVRESTAGRLYDDYMNFYYDIHSGGVSLQQTKEKEIYYILKSTFFLKNGEITSQE